jgi:hypothetical protein
MAVGPAGGAAETLAAIQQATANQNQATVTDNAVEQEVAESNTAVTGQGTSGNLNTINTTA